MKKILVINFIAFSCIILSVAAQCQTTTAQNKADVHHHCQHQQERMIQALNLTSDQQEKLKVSHDDFKKQRAALNQDESISLKDYRDKKYALRKEEKKQLLSILTPDQKAKLSQIKKDEKAKHELLAAKRIDKLKIKLNLSDEQVASIKANRQIQQTKVAAILQNDTLSRIDKKEQLLAIRNTNKENMKSILTPSQLDKWEELKQQKMQERTHEDKAQ